MLSAYKIFTTHELHFIAARAKVRLIKINYEAALAAGKYEVHFSLERSRIM